MVDRVDVGMAGVGGHPARGGGVGLDRLGVPLLHGPAGAVAAGDLEPRPRRHRAEHLDELGRLLGGEAHGGVGDGQIGLVGEAQVGDPDALTGVELRVLHQVLGVRPAPVAARAARAGQAAQRAAVDVAAVVLHVAGGAPGVGVEPLDPVRLGLPCEPHLAAVVPVPLVRRGRVRAAGVAGRDRAHVVVDVVHRGADAEPQDAQARALGTAEQQVEHLLLVLGRQALGAVQDGRALERLGEAEPVDRLVTGPPVHHDLRGSAFLGSGRGVRGGVRQHGQRKPGGDGAVRSSGHSDSFRKFQKIYETFRALKPKRVRGIRQDLPLQSLRRCRNFRRR